MAHAQGMAIGGVLVMVLVLVMALVFVSSVPLSPEITAYVQVSTTPYGYPQITLMSIGYQKVTIAVSASEPKDKVQITPVGTVSTTQPAPSVGYTLTVYVTYLGQTILHGNLANVQNGFYLIKASFWPRSEQLNVPYSVQIIVSYLTYNVAITSNLLPN